MLTPSRLLTMLTRRHAAALLGAVALTGTGLALPASAHASHRQIAIIQDGNLIQSDPAGTLARMRALGATTVRVVVYWTSLAPRIQATRRPNFQASEPGAYPAAKWAPYDTIVQDAAADGMTVDLTVAQGTPRWAEGPGIPAGYVISHQPLALYYSWKPDAADFGRFMHAVAQRYDGRFTPAGASAPLPRVHFWTIWNEPNFGEDLGPQATDTSRISYAPLLYRNLVRSGYRALTRTGHARDTILIGEFAAHGTPLSSHVSRLAPQGRPGNGGQTQPLPFIRTLYCLDQNGHKLTGTAARQVGCPTSAGGRASFRKDNPGLFKATGVGDHPYANDATPLSDGKGNPEWATLPNLPLLEHTLDQANRVWGSHRRFPIYNDEYGYITNPPNSIPGNSVPARTAARYINWAEYLSWLKPRTASYDQYLIDDPEPNGNGSFATGLYSYAGKPKPTLDAFRMPLWIPSATPAHAGRDKVWGETRPAYWTGRDTKQTQTTQIQFRAHGRGLWKTVSTVRSNTYFEVRPHFSESGDVRLRYTYPKATDSLLPLSVAGTTIVSRTQKITVG